MMKIKHKKRAKQNHSRAGDVFSILILIVMGSFMALPLVLAISNSLKPLEELFIFPPRFLVKNPTLTNFHDVFVLMSQSWVPFSRYIFNTVFITVVGTFGHLFVASLCAYALAKHNFPGQKVIFWVIVTALMFSTQVTAIPNYLIMSKAGFLDSYISLILPAIAKPLGLFLMKQFMEQIPSSLLEAARIDGASEVTTFWRIAMPQVKPAWLTLIIFCFQDLWNLQGSNYIYTEQLKTLLLRPEPDFRGGHIQGGSHGGSICHHDDCAHSHICGQPEQYHRDDGVIRYQRVRSVEYEEKNTDCHMLWVAGGNDDGRQRADGISPGAL